jgi:hypothetical protein
MSTPLPLLLPSATTRGRDGQVAGARLINGYTEINGDQGKTPFALYGVPGLTRWDTGTYTGIERGLIELSSSQMIAFLGNQVIGFDSEGGATALATLVGSGRLFLAVNRADPPEIGIVTPAGQYYVMQSGAITLNADADLPAPNSIDYLKGRFLFGISSGLVYCSDTDTATAINALAFGEINSSSDGLVRVFTNAGFGYFFGTKSLEIWQADASLAGQPFPFSPVQQDIELGLTGPHTVAKFEKALIWVDHNGIVRYGRDGAAERASNHAVERAIAGLTEVQKSEMVGSTHAFHGHEVYTLKGANFTYCLDIATARKTGLENAWYERKTYGLDRWQVNSSLLFGGKYIMGNETDGALYYLDPDAYTEAGAELVFEAHCPHSHKFPYRMLIDAVEVDVVSGVGLNSTTDSNANPELMVDYSDDGGKTFRGERRQSIGRLGEYDQTVRLNRWGRCTKKGRIWRFRASAAVLKALTQAYIHARPTR